MILSKDPIIIMTYGVFDLLHFGHIRSLRKAKELGDKLIVGVFSDRVAEGFKRKPIMTLKERMLNIQELGLADEIVIQDELEPFNNADKFGANIIAKGSGAGFENFKDSRCVLLPYTEGISTSEIIERICSGKY